jgi:PadR family transcriptional regulator, regulatory protein PadR
LKKATLYLSLKRLEKQKAVSAYWGKESHGGRRKYYAITKDGKELLDKFIQDWRHISTIVERFI